MMLNHANFVVSDVADAALFFTRHFHFAVLGEPRDGFAILRGADGFILNFMRAGSGDPATYPANFHVGCFVASVEEVEAKHAELVAAGYGPGDVQVLRRGGTITTTFYCKAPGGFLVEVACNAG